MASTPQLAAIITAAAVALAVLRLVAWRIVRAAAQAALSGSRPTADRLSQAGPGSWRSRVAHRHPGLATALSARVDPTTFTGLPLLRIGVAALVILTVLGGLVDLIHATHGDVPLDQAADAFFKPYRAAWMLKAALWITAIGAGPSLAAMLAVATVLLWSDARGRALAPLWIAFLGAQATTWTTKYIIARPRPVFLPHITEWNPSFPSGHATAVTALVGMLGVIVAGSVPSLRARFEIGFWAVAVIALICFSRIFLGVHFVTDVAAGILVGVFWVLVGYTVGALRRRAGG